LSCVPQCVVGLSLVLFACLSASAQESNSGQAQKSPSTLQLQQMSRVPGFSTFWRGFNAGVTFSGVHDSSIGWYTVATPAISYAFSPHYSVDASATIYPSRLVPTLTSTRPRSEKLVMNVGKLGDTVVDLHAAFNPGLFRNVTTVSFTIPTGDSASGLGAGEATFDFSNHLERYHKQATFLIDFGAGNSSGLFNRLLTTDYTSVGGLVHVQAGGALWLLGSNYIQSVFYEQYPIGGQTIYAPSRYPGGSGISYTVRGSEDNGVTTSVGIPLSDHFILSGYYSRSFQFNLDTVSTGMTYVLHGIPGFRKRLSMIDRALREAEAPVDNQQDELEMAPQKH
jgi:hypothetical protein